MQKSVERKIFKVQSFNYDTRGLNQISIRATFYKNLILYKNSILVTTFVNPTFIDPRIWSSSIHFRDTSYIVFNSSSTRTDFTLDF